MKRKNLATLAMLGVAGGLLVGAQTTQTSRGANTPSSPDSQNYVPSAPNSCSGKQLKTNPNNGTNPSPSTHSSPNDDKDYSSNSCRTAAPQASNGCNTKNASSRSFNSRLNHSDSSSTSSSDDDEKCGSNSCKDDDTSSQSSSGSLKAKRHSL